MPAQASAAPATPVEQPTEPTLSDEGKPSVNLKAAYSKVNEALIRLADGLGIPRTATLPHLDGQNMGDHVEAVGNALKPAGGVTKNLLNVGHSRHGSGETVAHLADKARETLITKDNADAKAAISAAKGLVRKIEFLIGDQDPVKVAKNQLAIVGKSDGENMTVLDLNVALHQIVAPVIQAVARAHSGTKEGGHSPQLRPPYEPQDQEQQAAQDSNA